MSSHRLLPYSLTENLYTRSLPLVNTSVHTVQLRVFNEERISRDLYILLVN